MTEKDYSNADIMTADKAELTPVRSIRLELLIELHELFGGQGEVEAIVFAFLGINLMGASKLVTRELKRKRSP